MFTVEDVFFYFSQREFSKNMFRKSTDKVSIFRADELTKNKNKTRKDYILKNEIKFDIYTSFESRMESK